MRPFSSVYIKNRKPIPSGGGGGGGVKREGGRGPSAVSTPSNKSSARDRNTVCAQAEIQYWTVIAYGPDPAGSR